MQHKDAQAITKFIKDNLKHNPIANAAIFNTMRILKKLNKGDSYYENYLWHYEKRKDTFVDYYHLLWALGSSKEFCPKRIIEIGCRTGISIAQLLSAMIDYEDKKVFLFDTFNDGFISPELVKMNLKYLNIPLGIIEFKVGDSLETIPKFIISTEERFDYILVDGCHDKDVARKDMENVLPLLADGGIIFMDDLSLDGCNLLDVWEDFIKSHLADFYFLGNMDGKGIGIAIKKGQNEPTD